LMYWEGNMLPFAFGVGETNINKFTIIFLD